MKEGASCAISTSPSSCEVLSGLLNRHPYLADHFRFITLDLDPGELRVARYDAEMLSAAISSHWEVR